MDDKTGDGVAMLQPISFQCVGVISWLLNFLTVLWKLHLSHTCKF